MAARPSTKVRGSTGTVVRVASTMSIPAVLRSLGADPAKVLAEAGYEPEFFDNPDTRISFAARSRLLAHCATATRCPHFGLLVGQRAGLNSLGLIGLLIKYAPDVGSALLSLVRYLHLHVRGATTSLVTDERVAKFTWDVYQPRRDGVVHVDDGALAAIFNIMRALCGPDWKPTEVWFAHPPPPDAGPFHRFFSAPLRFDAERNAVVFAAAWLSRPVLEADQELRWEIQVQIDALEARHVGEFPAQVRSVLSSVLLTDDAGVERVAALFSMHRRTFNRRLAAYGTCFKELADESRFELARQMLEESSYAVGDAADTLGYADASAFIRAFRRWTGTTPAHWRSRAPRARRR